MPDRRGFMMVRAQCSSSVTICDAEMKYPLSALPLMVMRTPRITAPTRLRRGGREVECTALEMRHTGNRIVGSNPPLSAMTWVTLPQLPASP